MSRTRRRLNPDERRTELLEAAVTVLGQLGPATCRVEDITTEAGTAKGNFYRYFNSFDDLLVAVRDHLLDRYRDEVEARLAARGSLDWWEVLDEEIDMFLSYQTSLDGLHDVLFHGPAALSRPIDDERTADALIAWILNAGIRDDTFAAVDVEPTASLIFHVLHGAADHIRAGGNRQRTSDAAHRMIRRTLRPDAPLGTAR